MSADVDDEKRRQRNRLGLILAGVVLAMLLLPVVFRLALRN